jgi:hypothetical protein
MVHVHLRLLFCIEATLPSIDEYVKITLRCCSIYRSLCTSLPKYKNKFSPVLVAVKEQDFRLVSLLLILELETQFLQQLIYKLIITAISK